MSVADDLQEREQQAGNAEDRYDPSQQAYNDEFSRIAKDEEDAEFDDIIDNNYGEGAGAEKTDAHGDKVRRNYNADEPEDSRKDVKDKEENPSEPKTNRAKKEKGGLRSRLAAGSKKYGPTGGVVGLIVGTFGLGSVMLSPLGLLTNLSSIVGNHIDLGNHIFTKTGKSLMSAVWKGSGRNCATSKIKCKFATISDRRVKQWEKRGIKVIKSESKIPGITGKRYKIRGLEFPDGTKVSSLREYNQLRYKNPVANSLLKRFPIRAGFVNEKSSIKKALKKFKLSLGDKFKSSKKKEKEKRAAENKEKMNKKTGVEVDKNGKPKRAPIKEKVKAKVKGASGKVTEKLKSKSTSFKVAGGLDAAAVAGCMAYNLVRATRAAVMLYWHEELIKFALPFLQAGSQAKEAGVNGEFDWETAEYFGDRLMQPVTQEEADADPKDDVTDEMVGKTAMDSKGFMAALNGEHSSLSGNYAENYTGWAPVDKVAGSGIVKALQDSIGKGNIHTICKTAKLAMILGLGACAAKILQCVGTFLAVTAITQIWGDDMVEFITDKLTEPAIDVITKANLTSTLHGPKLGQAIVGGAGVMSSYMDRASGFAIAGDPDQARQAYYNTTHDPDYLQDQIADARANALENQFDVSNQFSFAGQLVSRATSVPWNGSLFSVFSNIARVVASIPSSANVYAIKQGIYQPIGVYETQENFDGTLKNCTSPGMNDTGLPCMGESGRAVPTLLKPVTDCLNEEEQPGSQKVCIEAAVDYLSEHQYKNNDDEDTPYIDKVTGKPNDWDKYEGKKKGWDKNPFLKFMRYCGVDREYPIGYTTAELDDENYDWEEGSRCAPGKNNTDNTDLAWMSYYYNTCIVLYASEEDSDYCWEDKPAAQQTTPSTQSNRGVIAIDPGHSVPVIHDIESSTGAELYDYPNGREVDDVWDVALAVKAKLEQDGYTVKMLKTSKGERVNFQERANRAKGSAMALSIHTNKGGGNTNQVAPQFVGGYRSGTNGTITFESSDVANRSNQCAGVVAQKRTEKEGHNVAVRNIPPFDGRGGNFAKGNMPWVQLLSPDTPWIYNEFDPPDGGGGSEGISEASKAKYVEGLVAGLEACNISKGDGSENTTPENAPAKGTDGTTTSFLPLSDDETVGDENLVAKRSPRQPFNNHFANFAFGLNKSFGLILPEYGFIPSYAREWGDTSGV